MFKNHFKIILRQFYKNKMFSAITIGSLSFGFAIALLTSLYTVFEINFDTFQKDYQQIYKVQKTVHYPGKADSESGEIESMIADWIETSFPEVKSICKVNSYSNMVRHNNNAFKIDHFIVTSLSFPEIFPCKEIYGNMANALSNPNSIVLVKSMSEKLFGNEMPIGKQVTVDNQFEYIVTAVIEDMPKNTHLEAEAIVAVSKNTFSPTFSITSREGDKRLEWSTSLLYVKLKNINNAFEKKLNTNNNQVTAAYLQSQFIQQIGGNKNEVKDFEQIKTTLKLVPINEVYMESAPDYETGIKHGNPQKIFLLIVITLFIILIAAINYINMTTSRCMIRAKEIGIQKVLGESRFRLFIQFILESVVFCLISSLLALFISSLLIKQFNNLMLTNLSFSNYLTFSNILIVIAGVVFVGIAAGTYPAFYLSRIKPKDALYDLNLKGVKGSVIRNWLIVIQFTIAIVFIISSGFIILQLDQISKKDLGFNKEHLIHIPLHSTVSKNCEVIKNNFLRNPNILSVTISNGVPGSCLNTYEPVSVPIRKLSVMPDFIPTFGMKILEGRNFNFGDENHSCILNETAVKAFGFKDPLGEKTGPVEVIGVVKDFHFESAHSKIGPLILWCSKDNPTDISVKVSAFDIHSTLKYMKETWEEIIPDIPFEFIFYEDWVAKQYLAEKKLSELIIYISLITIVISCFGLIGLTMFTLERRIREIGIRKINGAKEWNILVLLNRDFVKWVAISFIIACPIAYYAMTKWLENFAYKTELSWWIFALAGLLALGIALLTVSWQSWKAATRNPVEALRYE